MYFYEDIKWRVIKLGHDIAMVSEEGETLKVQEFKAGGRYACNRDRAEISITYNYAWFFYKFMSKDKGIKLIYGVDGRVAKPIIQKMIDELIGAMGDGDSKVEYDYWIPTPNNVTKVLRVLLSWCEQHPLGICFKDVG